MLTAKYLAQASCTDLTLFWMIFCDDFFHDFIDDFIDDFLFKYFGVGHFSKLF